MIGSLPFAFAQPLVLLGLLSLPVLWWLLRMIPPRPRLIAFPPARLLFDIAPKEETPARTPWWLTLLRLTLAALLILAAAGPMWNPSVATSGGSGPLVLLIDDGWAAASTWDIRARTADDVLARAEADGRAAALIPMSEAGRTVTLQTAAAARVQLQKMAPKPHAVERAEVLPALSRVFGSSPNAELVWLSDGTHLGAGSDFVSGLAGLLEGRTITVVEGGVAQALALSSADNNAGALTVKISRAAADGERSGTVRAYDLKGLLLAETPFALKASERETEAMLDLPVELRNDIARLEIAGERSAGAVQLLDKRWRRRSIGVITGATADTAQPLLASTFYLQRALSPFADVRMGERVSPSDMVVRFIDQNVPMLILADVGNVVGTARERLAKWVEDGGVLVRFAGPRLAASDDDLVPVRLRRGGRTLGGSLSWEKPQPLAAFSREGPFGGMPVPNDVTVSRQVLAEPDSGLAERSWATLADGTPLVTGARRGKGIIVLFHVTADTRWSDLPLSGTFVEMLKNLVSLAGSTATAEQASADRDRETLAPARALDGYGVFGAPPGSAKPVPANYAGRATADHPPGFYGPPEGLLAVNTLTAADRPDTIDIAPLNARRDVYRLSEPHDLRGPIFLAALGLLLIDALVVFWLAGGLSRLTGTRRRAVASGVVLAVILAGAGPSGRAEAQTATPRQQTAIARPSAALDDFAMKAANQTKLAYVVTGDADTDAISKSGLSGLTIFLAQRTALEGGEPVGLDIARDELAFFPLIYWPIVPGAAKPSPEALARIDTYMKQGGTVLFDTRDAIMAPPGPGGEARSPGMLALREILASLDIPELEPVSKDHVLTKTFFLLRDFPGRFNTGQLWVEALPAGEDLDGEIEARPARAGDGVSSIMITSNDLAGAWAMRPDGQQMLPMVASEPRAREMAYRAGVNIVMYALTGNYKADQVHVPALLERLGQ
ncbi:DUF4159 domain-containing protein [Pseudorhodoplanes sp.]|uniref:DUF4159 domain-containing protein n=1 Tax=Pseudorhodoplanes sp. TaxID=1934341 RepID=UPI00391C599D